ncbi:9846_t:CDS:2 [Entrophospora sp. SA101]|nr:14046_t:CDS:2 [Entrophospora sp. SA101]CAJ0837173.1 14055_t:CDS:2 [Entrophospora sp. SA101]CAJ0864274.1 9846_t:CDS:2 [Entrophospora sp. SA101]
MTFDFCRICKRNNSEGKKHLYTKLHQGNLLNILNKEITKYKKYRIFLKDITIVYDVNKQPDFWCFFCEVNVEITFKNVDEKQIICEHIFEHIVTKNHHDNVIKYFKDQKADCKLINNFILKKDEIDKFRRRSKELQKKNQLKKEERELKSNVNQESNNISISILDKNDKMEIKFENFNNNNSTVKPIINNKLNINEEKKKKRDQLTRIKVPPLKPGEGNVFEEGSVPPWLQDDDDMKFSGNTNKTEIGPSLDAFLAAKKLEKKKKLNPNRVGANFDRESAVGKDWVPNFGRVWNNGTRNRSQKQYKKEMKSIEKTGKKQK